MNSGSEIPRRVALSRNLGLSNAVLLGIGAIVGGGIFALTGLVAEYAGPAMPLVILINGAIAATTALAYAELSSAFPAAGGGYRWVRDAYGSFVGHMSGWASWFAQSVACALYALSFGYYALEIWAAYVFPLLGIRPDASDNDIFKRIIAAGIVLLFGLFNFRSVSSGRRLGDIITVLEIGVILFFIVTGFSAMLVNPHVDMNFSGDLPHGIFGIFAAAGIMYIAFEGSEIVAQSGEELKNPNKNLPRAILISFGVVVLMYFGVMIAALGGINAEVPAWQILADAGEGALIVAASYFSPFGAMLVTFGGALAGLAAMNATIYSSSHVSFAMGREGQLPRILGTANPRRHTPDWALAASLGLILCMAIFFPLKEVASVADMLFIIIFIQLQLTVIALRKKRPDAPRPFKVPLYPVLQIAAIVGYLFIGSQFLHVSPVGLIVVVVWLALGFIVYRTVARRNYKEDFSERQLFDERFRTETPAEYHYRIVVPFVGTFSAQAVVLRLEAAKAMAKGHRPATIYVVGIHAVHQSRTLGSVLAGSDKEETQELEREHRFIQYVAQKLKDTTPDDVNVESWVHLGRPGNEADAILQIVERYNADLLVLGWRGWTTTQGRRLGATLDQILYRHSCDLIIVKQGENLRAQRIFIPSSGGAHARFAAEVAAAFVAGRKRSTVTLARIVSPDMPEDEKAKSLTEIYDDAHWTGGPIKIEAIPSENVSRAILARETKVDVYIMAASRGRAFKEFLVGNTAEIVARESVKTVIIAKHYADIRNPLQDFLRRQKLIK